VLPAADKAGGDYLDLLRLASHPAMTRSIAIPLSAALHDLGSWCSREIFRRMIEDADRTAGVTDRSGTGARTPRLPLCATKQ
jgi:hypothetical protein